MKIERSARFDQLLDKVIALGDASKLTAAEKKEYDDLCNDWNDRDRVANSVENFGF